ncbi:hypothetical protein Q3G72_005115 [Acer saccharum]|nr:hypothetical protein Q3G72_005115 [Acer saccharum]
MQKHRAKAVAEASHRDATDQVVSGIAPPQDYGTSEDEGVLGEEVAERIAKEIPRNVEGKSSGSTIDKGKKKIEDPFSLSAASIPTTSEVVPTAKSSARKDHSPLVVPRWLLAPINESLIPLSSGVGAFFEVVSAVAEGSIPINL